MLSMNKGFTLIELMVSVAIFSVVMVISLGALLAISNSDKKAETLKSVMNNLNFALDSMSRSIRTGSVYNCGAVSPLTQAHDCATTPANSLTFLSVDGKQTTYFLDTNASNCGQSGTIGCIRRTVDSTTAQITSPEIIVSNLAFYVKGAPLGDGVQPKVTITISGYVVVSGSGTCGTTAKCTQFNIQTSVTQRIYDQ